MAIATDAQVQAFVDQRLRPFAEALRSLVSAAQDDQTAISDVYNACNQQSPTWADNRRDGPPFLLAPQDVLNFNTFTVQLINAMKGTSDGSTLANLASLYPAVLKGCVRSLQP